MEDQFAQGSLVSSQIPVREWEWSLARELVVHDDAVDATLAANLRTGGKVAVPEDFFNSLIKRIGSTPPVALAGGVVAPPAACWLVSLLSNRARAITIRGCRIVGIGGRPRAGVACRRFLYVVAGVGV